MNTSLLVGGIVYAALLIVVLWYRTAVDPWHPRRRLGMGVFYVGVGTVTFLQLEALGLLFCGVGVAVLLFQWIVEMSANEAEGTLQ